jgi:hypothetical protein
MSSAQSFSGLAEDRAVNTVVPKDTATHTPRYAVLFRTHTWDSFIERQFERVRARVENGDVFIVANNTSGTCGEVEGFPFVAFHEDEIEAMGYARAGGGELLWYNVDYALYYFMRLKPNYDFYILFEYDVVVNVELDALIEAVAENGKDLVGLTKGDPVSDWWFRPSCLDVYAEADIRKMLLPLGVFSKRAVEHLSERKLRLSEMLRAGEIGQWPHCEAFIVTELALAGFEIDEFTNYGTTAKLSYEPAYLEQELGDLESESFIHPVLDTQRYIANVIKYEWCPERFFLRSSEFRRRLTRVPPRDYILPLGRALGRRIGKMPSFVAKKMGVQPG